MPAAIAIRRFGYAPETDHLGLSTVHVEPGDEFDCPASCYESLLAEGYLAPAGTMAERLRHDEPPALETKPAPAEVQTPAPIETQTPAPLETKPARRGRRKGD